MANKKNTHHPIIRAPKSSAAARAEVLAMTPKGTLVQMTFDGTAASSQAIAVLDAILGKVPHLVRVPGCEEAKLAELRKIAEVAHALEAEWLAEKENVEPEGKRRARVKEARLLRKVLVSLLPACVLRGAATDEEVEALVLTGDGPKLPDELRTLARFFLARFDAVGGGLVTKDELEAVEADFVALKQAVKPVRARYTERQADLAASRQRVFTVLFERYSALRHAVVVALDEATDRRGLDVDGIAPSLIVRRRGRKVKAVGAAGEGSAAASGGAAVKADAPKSDRPGEAPARAPEIAAPAPAGAPVVA